MKSKSNEQYIDTNLKARYGEIEDKNYYTCKTQKTVKIVLSNRR